MEKDTYHLLPAAVETLRWLVHSPCVDVQALCALGSGTWRHVLPSVRAQIDMNDSHAHRRDLEYLGDRQIRVFGSGHETRTYYAGMNADKEKL
jgi:hypothetical protein